MATVLGLAEVTTTILCTGCTSLDMFFASFITILILFLGIASIGSSHPPCPISVIQHRCHGASSFLRFYHSYFTKHINALQEDIKKDSNDSLLFGCVKWNRMKEKRSLFLSAEVNGLLF